MTAAGRPESQEQILEAAVASLTEADIPPAEQDGWLDPDADPPAELAVLPDAGAAELLAAAPSRPAPPAWPLSYPHPDQPGGPRWPAGSGPRDGGGAGFASGDTGSGPRDGGGAGFASGDTGSGPRDGGGAGFASGDTGSGPRDGGGTRFASGDTGSGPRDGIGAGFASSDTGFASGPGAGFAEGGPLDVLAAGMALAGFADEAHARADALDDDCLIGMLRAWRRLASWAQAQELATVAALARRRPADGTPPAAAPGGFPARLSEFIAAEVAAALTLTGCAAGAELDLALDLAARPATAAALGAGRIDLPRAKLITGMLGPLSAGHAAAVEAQILPRAGEMTTGQLRAALQRAVLLVDPDAARRRREQAEQEARVEHWADPEGTATLAGRCLPPAAALTASKRMTQIAGAWKKQGAMGGMDLLRAHAYLALLNGHSVDTPPPSLLPPGISASGPSQAGGEPTPGLGDGPAAGGQQVPAGLRGPGASELPPAAGLINLTVPLTTLLGLAAAPGESAGYGPLDADTTRLLARTLAGHPATRWQITVTSPGGQALAHGTARGAAVPAASRPGAGRPEHGQPEHGQPRAGQPEPAQPGTDEPGCRWTVAVTAEPITTGTCGHRTAEPGYRPSPALQRLIRARTVTCAAPGCRRPAARCDLDHTIPHDKNGITCECNLAPLCRFCHRLKQAHGWKLTQASPGVMTWTTPAGRRYTTLPSKHPT